MEKTGFCDVGCNFFGGVFGLTFFGESAAECEYAANSGLYLFSGKFVEKKLSPKVKKSSKM